MKGKKVKYRTEIEGGSDSALSVTGFDYEGTFCEFGLQSYMVDGFICSTSVAIIMLDSGDLIMRHPEHVRFV